MRRGENTNKKTGSYLLSHGRAAVPSAYGRFTYVFGMGTCVSTRPVPSAYGRFTYVFGMGTCVSTRPWPPGRFRTEHHVRCDTSTGLGRETNNMVKPHGSLVPVG